MGHADAGVFVNKARSISPFDLRCREREIERERERIKYGIAVPEKARSRLINSGCTVHNQFNIPFGEWEIYQLNLLFILVSRDQDGITSISKFIVYIKLVFPFFSFYNYYSSTQVLVSCIYMYL